MDNKITQYNYVTNDIIEFSIPIENCEHVELHPNGKKIKVEDVFGRINVCKIKDLPLISKNIELEYLNIGGSQYSFDGSYIITFEPKNISIINAKNDKNQVSIPYHFGTFCAVSLLPQSLVIAVLLVKKAMVEYWDIKKKSLICSSDLDSEAFYNLSFSLDERQVILTREDKCVGFPVPAQIFWHNKHSYFLFLLKHSLRLYHETPDDIAFYIMNIAKEL